MFSTKIIRFWIFETGYIHVPQINLSQNYQKYTLGKLLKIFVGTTIMCRTTKFIADANHFWTWAAKADLIRLSKSTEQNRCLQATLFSSIFLWSTGKQLSVKIIDCRAKKCGKRFFHRFYRNHLFIPDSFILHFSNSKRSNIHCKRHNFHHKLICVAFRCRYHFALWDYMSSFWWK